MQVREGLPGFRQGLERAPGGGSRQGAGVGGVAGGLQQHLWA